MRLQKKSPIPVESLQTYTETELERKEVKEPRVWLYLDTAKFTRRVD